MSTKIDLHKIVEKENVSIFQRELKKSPERVNECDRTGTSLLQISSLIGNLEIVTILLSNDPPAQVNQTDRDGKTALHSASSSGRASIAELLIEYGGSINCASSSGWTPLHCCCINGNLDVAMLLVEKGSVCVGDKQGHTPLYYAARYNQQVNPTCNPKCVTTSLTLNL